MADKIIGIGMYRRKDNILGECVEVIPMQWDEREGRPVGIHTVYDMPFLQDLEFSGYVGDYMSADSVNEPDWPYYHGSEAVYRQVYSADWRKAKVMADFLGKVLRGMEKAHARDAGDRFMVFAAAMKAQKVWFAKGPDHMQETYPRRTEYVQCSVVEGRDVYRRFIAEAKAAMRARLCPAREAA